MSAVMIESEVEEEAAVETERRPISADEYFHMAEQGFFKDERIELVEGEILRMSPIGSPHSWLVRILHAELVRQLADPTRIAVQSTLPLDAKTVVEPDLVLCREGARSYRDPHPGPADVLLLIEVSESSVRYDRKVKARLYARARIVEYWIVDVAREIVIVHREPGESGYASVVEHPWNARVALSAPGAEGLDADFARVFR